MASANAMKPAVSVRRCGMAGQYGEESIVVAEAADEG